MKEKTFEHDRNCTYKRGICNCQIENLYKEKSLSDEGLQNDAGIWIYYAEDLKQAIKRLKEEFARENMMYGYCDIYKIIDKIFGDKLI